MRGFSSRTSCVSRLGALAGAGMVALALAGASLATFTSSPTAGPLPISTYQLAPPSSVTLSTGKCHYSHGSQVLQISVAWTQTASSRATGYEVLRSTSSGGPFALIATLSGLTTLSTTDTSGLSFGTTYYYVVRSLAGSWESADSAVHSITVSTSCSATTSAALAASATLAPATATTTTTTTSTTTSTTTTTAPTTTTTPTTTTATSTTTTTTTAATTTTTAPTTTTTTTATTTTTTPTTTTATTTTTTTAGG